MTLVALTLALAACSEAPPKKDVIATVNGVEITSDQIVAEARASGVAIKDLATEDPDLEDVFLALTYGGGKDPLKD